MSVSDPLIKDLKGCISYFLQESKPVTDECEAVEKFCEALERILEHGLMVQMNALGYWRDPATWHWLEKMALDKYGAPYMYQMSVEKVGKCEKVRSNVGRTRLLIRHCLNSRCLHVPFQLLLETKQFKQVYSMESVLGSDILSQILMSVVLLPSRLQFKLDVDNARFLDDSWQLPNTRRLTFVPAHQLGISLTFVEGKAIVVEVLPDSVASEDKQIEVGDVLDELNGVVIVPKLHGCLGQVLRKSPGHPITAYIIKAKHKEALYGALVPLLRRAGLNLAEILDNEDDTTNGVAGNMTYMGYVLTADRGDVREIRRAINQLLQEPQEPVRVSLDCLDIGVKVTLAKDATVLLNHAYMQISSCGCTVEVPHYFAYIVEDRSVSADNRFVCHVFNSENQQLIDNTLTSIGQGFKRTRFAV